MFIDITMPDGYVKEWKEASKSIIECAERAERLLARSACCAHALVYQQVLSVVEHYFLCVLPVPAPKQVEAQMLAGDSAAEDQESGSAHQHEDDEEAERG